MKRRNFILTALSAAATAVIPGLRKEEKSFTGDAINHVNVDYKSRYKCLYDPAEERYVFGIVYDYMDGTSSCVYPL